MTLEENPVTHDPQDQSALDERYRAFIENIEDGVYETNIYGDFTYFNDAMCRIFGRSREEMEGRNFGLFMEKSFRRAAFQKFNKIFITRIGFSDLIWEITAKNGQKRIIELSANLIVDNMGKKKGFRGIARDVTEKIKAQEALIESEKQFQCQYEASRRAEKKYRTLLDFAPYPIVVFTRNGNVSYLNPAFTNTFGWDLAELVDKKIPYIPAGLEQEAMYKVRRQRKKEIISRHVSKRMTKDGRTLDVIMRGALHDGGNDEGGGELVILRDITQEKRMARNNEALLRISMALHEYPDLEDRLDYISGEIKNLVKTEGALVILHDEEKNELFFQGASYDDRSTLERAKEIRYPAQKTVAARVIRTGEPVIVQDTSKDPNFYSIVDERLGFHTKNLLEVPLRSSHRIIGALCAINKKDGPFDQTDIEIMNMISSPAALSIENARFSNELKEAYKEVSSLNRAKGKVINHLSHELKTPLSVLIATMDILEKRLNSLQEENGLKTINRAKRNLDRLLDIQYEVDDIMQDKEYRGHHLISNLLDRCTDALEALVAREVDEGPIIEKIKQQIEDLFGPSDVESIDLDLSSFVEKRLDVLKTQFAHRRIEILSHFEKAPLIRVPIAIITKVVDGLVKNAIENTPDGGKIEIIVHDMGDGVSLIVHDFGVGIILENQRRIFEGFFSTQETLDYSSKSPFDFNAGGKGADLLRMKIFAERYHFTIKMTSSRCRFIPTAKDECPGNIDQCPHCKSKDDCYHSGGTGFSVIFPKSSSEKNHPKQPVDP